MPSPTPAGGYIFPWPFQSSHICHKRTVTRAQGAHKARPSSEGTLQAPAALAIALLPYLTQQQLTRISWERQLRPPPCQKPCLSPKGPNMTQEPTTEKFLHTPNTWEKTSVSTSKEHHCMVPTGTLWKHVEHYSYFLRQVNFSDILLEQIDNRSYKFYIKKKRNHSITTVHTHCAVFTYGMCLQCFRTGLGLWETHWWGASKTMPEA